MMMGRTDQNGERAADRNRRSRRRTKLLLLVLVSGLLFFSGLGTGLYYALQPTVLRIAVGPPESDDDRLIKSIAQAFADENRSIRLAPITTASGVESLSLLQNSKADLAVARSDLEMPSTAEIAAIVRQNFVVLWTFTRRPPARERSRAIKIQTLTDLAGRRVGVIGRTPATAALLQTILRSSGVAGDKVDITQFGVDELDKLSADKSLDAFMAVGPLDSHITSDAIAITARSRGNPKFLAIDASEAIALRQPIYTSEEIPPGVFNSSPPWPDDKIETISFDNLIVAQRSLSEATVAAFARQLFSIRHSLSKESSGASHIKKPDTEKDAALPVHRGAAAFIDGNERSFLDRYGDYFWFALLLLSGVGSAFAWIRQFLRRDDEDDIAFQRKEMVALIDDARGISSTQELNEVEKRSALIVQKMLDCYEDDAVDEVDLSAFILLRDLLNQTVADRKNRLEANRRLDQSHPIALHQR